MTDPPDDLMGDDAWWHGRPGDPTGTIHRVNTGDPARTFCGLLIGDTAANWWWSCASPTDCARCEAAQSEAFQLIADPDATPEQLHQQAGARIAAAAWLKRHEPLPPVVIPNRRPRRTRPKQPATPVAQPKGHQE